MGVSSYQLDTEERGFSYRFDADLDMRMDRRQSLTAKDIVNGYSEMELFHIIRDYGEDNFAKNIAKHIVKAREIKEIETTGELNEIIKAAIPAKMRQNGHPSKKTFQAIRIECNRELEVLKNALEDFQRKNHMGDKGNIRIYIDQSENPEMETELFVDADYKHLPLRDYENMLGVMNSVIRDYDKIGKRNKKKDDNHLNKHAMHLVRLFMMAIDILEKGEIRTHRTDDLELLKNIRRGDFQKADGTYQKEFYDLLSDYEKRLEVATAKTTLPDNPDMDKVGAFVEYVNRRTIEGDF